MIDMQTIHTKFSEVDEQVYFELEKFVHYLAGRNAGPACLMEYDDIVGELLLELAKGLKAYPSLPKEQLKAVIRKMMDNRISELKYRFYVTSRNAELHNISINIEVNTTNIHHVTPSTMSSYDGISVEELIEASPDPADVFDSKERVLCVRNMLSPSATKVFDAVIYGNQMFALLVWLGAIRSGYVFKQRVVKIRPWHIADALHMEEKEVRSALKEIKVMYREVANV